MSSTPARNALTATSNHLRRLSKLLIATVLSILLLIAYGATANADSTSGTDTNWSGVRGKPTVLGSSPVTYVHMDFNIPVIDCKQKAAEIVIWAGLDSHSTEVSQAGVKGSCASGKPSWLGWYEVAPDFILQPIAELADLHVGQNVALTVAYRPDITADAFMASFQISEPNVPVKDISTIFYSAAGAAQRAEAECIVERPQVFQGGKWVDALIPKFTEWNSNGADFAAICLGGTDAVTTLLTGAPGTGSSVVLIDMQGGRLASWITHNQPIYNTTIVHPYVEPGGVVRWHWLASR